MKLLEKNKAIELRRQGKTLGEILKEVSVSKGSLSYWLRNISLTDEQLARIKYKSDIIKDKFIKFNESKRKESENNKRIIVNKAIREINSASLRELKLIGIGLYWAEGYKGRACRGVEFTNTDPAMIKLMMRWFREICCVQESQFRIRIQIHNATDVAKIRRYWSSITGIPTNQFTKTYIKTSPTSKRKSGILIPYGVCSIRISDIKLITRIRGWIKGLMALSSSPAQDISFSS